MSIAFACAFLASDLKQEGRDIVNIFWEYEDIFGRAETTHLNRTMEELLNLAGSIRRRLENKGYLLDQYLSMLLEGAAATKLFAAAQQGFYATNEVRRMCHLAMEGQDDSHPLFETVREHIRSHPLRFQETSTKQELYCAMLSSEFMEHAAKQHWHTLKETQRACYDIVALRDLYRQISATLGGETDMEWLNLLFRQRFLAVPAMMGYLQGMTNDLAETLTTRDPETNRLVFQLWLEQTGN